MACASDTVRFVVDVVSMGASTRTPMLEVNDVWNVSVAVAA